jgi:hypothetical protein
MLQDDRELKIEEIKQDTIDYVNKYGTPPTVFRVTKNELKVLQGFTNIQVEHNNKIFNISMALLKIEFK